ncbi:hypothetical protein [Streptomyces sp. NPDC014733]|uniref:hypothetical protein n=1 Tax=Streptomyces sp. NPDC014733 TaxID=3364885 RepID=UPI0036F75791
MAAAQAVDGADASAGGPTPDLGERRVRAQRRGRPHQFGPVLVPQGRFAAALLFLVGVVNLLPGVVAITPSRIGAAYGVAADADGSPDLVLLLRHRAVLLALVGTGLLCAAFLSSLRVPAMAAGGVSMGTFLLFARVTPALNGATMRVARIDLAALVRLAVAAGLVRAQG